MKNSNIDLLLNKCRKNHRDGQRQLFLLLHEFALRICYRYSSIEEDPTIPMYEGFIKLFKSIRQFNYNAEAGAEPAFRNWVRDILIDSYIEKGKYEDDIIERNSFGRDDQYAVLNEKERFGAMSGKKIIDTLRRLPFLYRIVFNLSVIDGFGYDDISSKLQVSVRSVEYNLIKARQLMDRLLQPINEVGTT